MLAQVLVLFIRHEIRVRIISLFLSDSSHMMFLFSALLLLFQHLCVPLKTCKLSFLSLSKNWLCLFASRRPLDQAF